MARWGCAAAVLAAIALPEGAARAQQQSASPEAAQTQAAPPETAQTKSSPRQGPQAQSAQPQGAATQAAPPAAASAAGPLPPAGPPNAEQILLEKANYWRLKDRPDLAAEALQQLLQVNPNNPDALYQFGLLSVQQNKMADAQRYLTKLQQVAANDPHIADLEAAIRTGKIGPTDLSAARQLAKSGQLDEAVKKYQEVFRGAPPPGYGVEYYMTLAGTPGGWDEARQGLERLVQQSPDDPQLRLSLAEVYTYREPTRMQGVAMLIELSKNPIVGIQAGQAWKQTLTWLGGSPGAKKAFEQYLSQYPTDPDIQKLLADLKNQPAGAGGEMSQGYVELKKGQLAAAEREFLTELKANPHDAQALSGLGLVRLRQQRFGEARDLLARALKEAPDQRNEIGPALDSAAFWARVDEAKRAAAAKNYTTARAILGSLLAHPRADQWGAMMVLADVEAKMGKPAEAEATYRQVLRSHPGNPDATLGLANALSLQNKTAELDQLTKGMSPAERARFEKGMAGGGEAEKLRNEAKEASANGNNAAAEAKYKAAIAADPRDAWIRLDYARFLAGQNNIPAAFAVVDPAASGNTPTSILVASMFNAQQDHWVRALDLINSIPPAQRTNDINNFRDRIYVRGTIERAKQQAASGDVAGAKAILVQLYNDPAVTTDEKRQAPFVIMKDLHDYDTALQVTRDAYVKGGPNSVKAGADYAMLLMLKGGHDDEAAQVLSQISASGLVNNSNREDLTPVYITLAVRQADKLRQKGSYADAWDRISPYIRDNPDNTDLLLCAGRIYASAGRSTEAMEQFKKAYDQDADNMSVLRGVIQGAILAHEYGAANDYIDKGLKDDPQNPWLFYLRAQVAQAQGHNGDAVAALREARTLNLQQNPSEATTTTGGEPTPLTPGGSPGALPPNPFRSSEAILPPQLARITA